MHLGREKNKLSLHSLPVTVAQWIFFILVSVEDYEKTKS